jgi:RNA polymerase sigma-70 factor (ECF subfamily)
MATQSLYGRRENDMARMARGSEMNDADLQVFEDARPRLLGLAYRILGTRADAEDCVQDCFLKWSVADRTQINAPVAWLSSVCARRSLDLLRATSRKRVDYFGPWLPEPIHPATPPAVDSKLAASLTTAFLLLLERLTPKERAAYLLHEIFEQSYAETAAMLEMDEAACRQLVSRARRNIDHDKVRHVTPRETQDSLLRAFQSAVMSGSTTQLAALLSTDIRLIMDSGGKTRAATHVLEGGDALNVLSRAHVWWKGCDWEITDLNGGRGAILIKDNRPGLTISLACNEAGQPSDIFIVLNPDKLARLECVNIH